MNFEIEIILDLSGYKTHKEVKQSVGEKYLNFFFEKVILNFVKKLSTVVS